ncbi:hypothetical protein GVX76_00870 [[Haemophilus] felis]|nr:hypothetical protein [[Haemophilus] felis]
MANYQGQYVFRKSDKAMLMWTDVGELSPDFTALPPPTADHEWQGESWELPESIQQQRLAELQNQLIQQVALKADKLKDQILVGYPQAEIDSFYRQEREARDWVADHSKPAPMLSAIAENRGVPLAMLVEKVIEKADQVASAMGRIIGTRQAFEDRILGAKSIAELTAIEQEIELWQLSI